MEGPDDRPPGGTEADAGVKEPPVPTASPDGLPKIVSFRSLCRCGDEVWIENDGTLYRLRRTRQNKLILTK